MRNNNNLEFIYGIRNIYKTKCIHIKPHHQLWLNGECNQTYNIYNMKHSEDVCKYKVKNMLNDNSLFGNSFTSWYWYNLRLYCLRFKVIIKHYQF